MTTETSGSHPSGAAAEVKDRARSSSPRPRSRSRPRPTSWAGRPPSRSVSSSTSARPQAGEQLQSIGKPSSPGPTSCGVKARMYRQGSSRRSLGAPTM